MNKEFEREALLYGEAAMEKLKNARVALFGVGGLITVPVVAVVLGVLFKDNSAAEVGEGICSEGDGGKPRT